MGEKKLTFLLYILYLRSCKMGEKWEFRTHVAYYSLLWGKAWNANVQSRGRGGREGKLIVFLKKFTRNLNFFSATTMYQCTKIKDKESKESKHTKFIVVWHNFAYIYSFKFPLKTSLEQPWIPNFKYIKRDFLALLQTLEVFHSSIAKSHIIPSERPASFTQFRVIQE